MKNSFQVKTNKNRGGFTMLELLFALSIWILGFTAIISLFQLVIDAGSEAKDRLIAANLAQEGVEVVHSIRDSNYVKRDPWLNNFDSRCFTSNCELDYQSTTTSDLAGTNSPLLEYSSSTGVYGYSLSAPDASPSPFRRFVRLRKNKGRSCDFASSSDCVQVKVEVTWQRKGNEKSVEVENYIFDWD